MFRIGPVELGQRPLLAAVVAAEDDLSGLDRRTLSEIDVFEVRADMLPRPSAAAIRRVLRDARDTGKGVLLTIRSTREGGGAELTDSVRSDLFGELHDDCDAVDLEVSSISMWSSLSERCRRDGKPVLASFHDFSVTPGASRMAEIMEEAFSKGGNVFKLACKASGPEDVVRLLDFTYRNRERGIISLSMGPWGLMSRVVGPAFGSLLTYGFLSKSSAPGQLPVAELALRLREFLPSRLG